MTSLIFYVLVLSDRCLSFSMTRFVASKPPSVDVLDLYHEFLASNSSEINRTDTISGIKSLIQCSLMCLANNNFKCVAFAYESRERPRECLLFSKLTSKERSYSNTFKKIPECPNDFVHLKDYNKCYRMMPGSWNWSEGRQKCNEINSHPLIVNDYKGIAALRYFLSFPNACSNSIYVLSMWTSGTVVKPNQVTFVWKPFQMKDGQEPYLPITFNNWSPYQPDNINQMEFCLQVNAFIQYNDIGCEHVLCLLCEVDI